MDFPETDKDGRRLREVIEYHNFYGLVGVRIPVYEGDSIETLREKHGVEFDPEGGWSAKNPPQPSDFLPQGRAR